jgi:polyphosphate kinase
VGRFLEHARIFRFNNNNSPLYFISSADWMPRNLNKRIEALVPVDDDEIKSYLDRIISFNLADNVNSWVLLPDGRYKRVKMKSGEEKIDIFENFMR